jgi:hypothetical protein
MLLTMVLAHWHALGRSFPLLLGGDGLRMMGWEADLSVEF